TARRVPLADPAEVFVQATVDHARAPITFAWRRPRMAVLPHDPVANGPDVTIVTSEAELLRRLRTTLREDHLDPLLAQIQSRVRLGTRTLLGSLASAVAYAVVRGLDQPALVQQETAHTLLSVLDVADLVALEPGPDGLRVQRRTCCLAFTLPEARVCSSCCVPAAPRRSGGALAEDSGRWPRQGAPRVGSPGPARHPGRHLGAAGHVQLGQDVRDV